jgi:hypothetical protein
MGLDELAAKLEALAAGASLSLPMYRVMMLFEGRFGTLDAEALRRAAAFAEAHGCRFLSYAYTQRDPEFMKPPPTA